MLSLSIRYPLFYQVAIKDSIHTTFNVFLETTFGVLIKIINYIIYNYVKKFSYIVLLKVVRKIELF